MPTKMSGVFPLPAPRHLIASSSPFSPYEWGGYWFGGKEGAGVGGDDGYQGYGSDCSGLVCAGALLAGYHWRPWHAFTGDLTHESYSTSIDDLRTIQPGDVLVNAGEHVVTIYRIKNWISSNNTTVPNDIQIIASEGTSTPESNGVHSIWTNYSNYDRQNYEPRRLVLH